MYISTMDFPMILGPTTPEAFDSVPENSSVTFLSTIDGKEIRFKAKIANKPEPKKEEKLSKHEQLAEDLWKATKEKDKTAVISLLSAGADPNHPRYFLADWVQENVFPVKRPPLHTCCENGNFEILKILHNGGANVNEKGWGISMNPLQLACFNGHKEIACYLIQEAKCDITVTGRNPFVCACLGGNCDLVKYLFEKVFHKQVVNLKDFGSKTPLHHACSKGYTDVVDYLVAKAKADVNVQSDKKITPLHEACSNGFPDVVGILMNSHCSTDARDEENLTAFHHACINGHKNVVQFFGNLPNYHHYINLCGRKSRTPLHEACSNGHKDIVEYLAKDPTCNIYAKDEAGNTPIHLACITGRIETVKYLVEKAKCDINVKNQHDWTPLHFACVRGHKKLVEYLVNETNANLYATTDDGLTPLNLMGSLPELELTTTNRFLAQIGRQIGAVPVEISSRAEGTKPLHLLQQDKGTHLTEEDTDALHRMLQDKGVKDLLVGTAGKKLTLERVTDVLSESGHQIQDLQVQLKKG